MFLRYALLSALSSSLALAAAAFKYNPNGNVNLRIEGYTSTIFQGNVYSVPRNITTPSGGTHPCTGQNDGANPSPGPTSTTALNEGSQLEGFGFDGTYDSEFDDFFITSIGDSTETSTMFWGLLNNYQFTPTGGCQFQPQENDEVLWAYNAFNVDYFLKLTGPTTAQKGVPFTVNVIDGMSGSPIEGATIGTATTDANGNATLVQHTKELYGYQASAPNSIRSNRIFVQIVEKSSVS